MQFSYVYVICVIMDWWYLLQYKTGESVRQWFGPNAAVILSALRNPNHIFVSSGVWRPGLRFASYHLCIAQIYIFYFDFSFNIPLTS